MQTDGSFFDVVGIAASSGGLKALTQLVSGLPADFPAAIMVVQHISPDSPSYLAEILGRYTPMRVKAAENGERFARGTIYTAQPNRHLMVNSDGTFTLSSLDKVQFVRPAADVLFVTMAISYGDRSIAVILTGAGQDGAIGSLAIKRAGGTTIAQEDPEFPGMPESAIRIDDVDFIKPLSEIAQLLVNLATRGRSN